MCFQNNLEINTNRKSKFGFLDLYHMEMLLSSFYEDRSNSLSAEVDKNSNTHKGLKEEYLVNVCLD